LTPLPLITYSWIDGEGKSKERKRTGNGWRSYLCVCDCPLGVTIL